MIPSMATRSRRSVPKGNKRERTRAALLAAARELVREKGYEHTTLREVAQRAGMTSGAIYGNFRDREDLFIALADAYWPAVTPHVEPNASLDKMLRGVAKALIDAIPERRLAAPGRLTGMAYALTHETVRNRVREVTSRSYDAGAAWLGTASDRSKLTLRPDTLVRAVHALIEGFTYQRLITPDLFPDDVIYAAFSALADGATATQPTRKARR